MSLMTLKLFASTTVLATGSLLSAVLRGTPSPPLRPLPLGKIAAATSSRTVFERRILPIFAAKNPSSCSECHFSGVDLKNYILPSEAQTFAALRDQGMLDLKRPQDSRILRFIRMSRPQTPLLTQRARDVEYGAFRDWIVAAVKNAKVVNATVTASARRSGPAVPNEVIRHTRLDSVVASFERNVWSQEGRCMGCHRPDNTENVKKYGERVRWFVPNDPEATMRRLIAQGDVDVEKPEESRLLLKPLNKVSHGGGVKMLYGDAGYKLFRAWLEDYSASVKGKYHSAKDLPCAVSQSLVSMDSILTVNNAPLAWADKLLRVDVYAWDKARNGWAPTPIATGERGMFGGKDATTTSTNLIMFLIMPTGDAQQAQTQAKELRSRLEPGRYLLKYFCDTDGKLTRDYTTPTDAPEFYQGQQEITATPWFGSWASPVKVSFAPDNPAGSQVKQP